jgi:septum formation protein
MRRSPPSARSRCSFPTSEIDPLADPRLILASRSPQRAAILEQLGVEFEVVPAEIEERSVGDPVEVARENARAKALAVAGPRVAAPVLAADTVVAVDGRILPKAADEEQARRWLEALSGRAHEVQGGVCVVDAGGDRAATALTVVHMRALTAAEIDWYLATGEWRERAGGYAIQGRGAALVSGIEGDYLNVVGLPLPALIALVPNLICGFAG